MKKFFRPVVLFPDQYVDFSILMLIIFLVAIHLFVLSPAPILWTVRGAAAGLLLGTALVGWEWFWHNRTNHQEFRPSYVYQNLPVALLLIGFLGGDSVKVGVLAALLFFHIVVFAALLAVQFREKRRYRRGELFPKEIKRKQA